MPNVNAGDRIRATAVLLGPAGETQNVYYFRHDGLVPVGDTIVMEDLAGFLDNAYTDINSGVSSDYVYTEVRGFNVTQNAPMPTVAWPSLTAGGGGASSTVAGAALLVLFRTGISRALGRKYLGGMIPANVNGDGFWETALVTAGLTFATNFLSTFLGGTSLAPYLPGIITATNTFLGFISTVVTNNPAYQRRRRKGRGV